MITEKDKKQLKTKGMNITLVEKQLKRFKTGYKQLNIVAPATPEAGINQLNEEDKEKLRAIYNKKQKSSKIYKFVPASGAATRMFKKIFEILDTYDGSEEKYLEQLTDRSADSIYTICENIHEFAFYDDLASICANKGECIDSKINKKDYMGALNLIVSEKGLQYGSYPKGLIKFHKYKNEVRTSFEEHLVEGAMYAKSNKTVYIHFTISPEHLYAFKQHVKKVTPVYEEQFNVKFHINLSVQKEFTDTIAVNMQNEPVRDQEGNLIFRPGGHGALIENLNEINADLIFIKNIDNVVTDRLKHITVEYKELLAGQLINLKEKIDKYLTRLTDNNNLNDAYLTKISNFAQIELNIDIPENFKSMENQDRINLLTKKLNKPFRVCGMVKNEDEPGGGPFWIENEKGERSLQIIESSQFDKNNKDQMHIFKSATHFNPVDLVCATRDYKGKPFDLTQFTDVETGFISEKNMKGKPIKALEHPGLWNGAMANWITVFIEVPKETFNPVKTINDLLREEHRF